MRKVLAFFLLALSTSLPAQILHGLKPSGCNVDSFPKVSFVWNSPNPKVLESSHFSLSEDGRKVDFTLEKLPVDRSEDVKKSVLFLWEDMASHNHQSDFTRELLIRFFNETNLDSTDCFEVAVFDRQKDTEKGVLKPLVGEFTPDNQLIIKELSDYRRNNRQYSEYPLQSELYQAIEEGIDMLKEKCPDRSGVVVVITAGLNMKASGACTEMGLVYDKAIKADIPVYVVKYPVAGNTPEVNILAEKTYGLVVSSDTEVPYALEQLQQHYRGMDDRLRGCDYKFSFLATERDGKQHNLSFMADNNPYPVMSYIAPVSFGVWLSENWWVVMLASLLIIGGVVLVVFLVRKKNQKQEKANQAIQEQMRQHEERERRNREAMETLRREQQEKERAAKEAARREEETANEERLSKMMQVKNLYPRLKCRAGSDTFSYTILKPRISLGRDANNDVSFSMENKLFNNHTVSGRHAEIVFNGAEFKIINKSLTYTQGVVVNGQFYQQYALRNGDMIGLGEAIITFYV